MYLLHLIICRPAKQFQLLCICFVSYVSLYTVSVTMYLLCIIICRPVNSFSYYVSVLSQCRSVHSFSYYVSVVYHYM